MTLIYTQDSSCGAGYYLSNSGGCETCGGNCKECDKDKCITCYEGFYPPFYLAKNCEMCSSDIVNCDTCISSHECTSCMDGFKYYFDYIDCVICSEFTPNCLKCNIEGYCLKCDITL